MRWWDLDRVMELEEGLFPEDAWSRGMFWSELAHARGRDATRHYVVAESGSRLVGYAGLAVFDRTGDVQTIASARDHWGTGLGARLLTDLLTAATTFECREVLLEVRVDNARAQRLYERFGFEPIGIRRGYYQPGNVDALVMRLSDPAAPGVATAASADTNASTETNTSTETSTSTANTAASVNPANPATSATSANPATSVQGTETHG
ncbi:ribosomal protein S18-alanine N-acetyltransferase [Streptomyces sp. NPDC056669]|uniref:ribosomal protein S18-alanine N-acetyltransferase n=1 Tax=Streptomyces sp. NPDC056669 TaxID=3345903 RepID=UPI003696F3FE